MRLSAGSLAATQRFKINSPLALLPIWLGIFQHLTILMTDVLLKPWEKVISKLTWQGKILELNINCCRYERERKIGPKLYFDACYLIWMKDWMIVKNTKLEDLETITWDLNHTPLCSMTKLRSMQILKTILLGIPP